MCWNTVEGEMILIKIIDTQTGDRSHEPFYVIINSVYEWFYLKRNLKYN